MVSPSSLAGHLIHRFAITESDWHRIKQNIDSKCRTAYRRKQRGMPLTVKAFRGKAPSAYVMGGSGHLLPGHDLSGASDEDSMSRDDAELHIHQVVPPSPAARDPWVQSLSMPVFWLFQSRCSGVALLAWTDELLWCRKVMKRWSPPSPFMIMNCWTSSVLWVEGLWLAYLVSQSSFELGTLCPYVTFILFGLMQSNWLMGL